MNVWFDIEISHSAKTSLEQSNKTDLEWVRQAAWPGCMWCLVCCKEEIHMEYTWSPQSLLLAPSPQWPSPEADHSACWCSQTVWEQVQSKNLVGEEIGIHIVWLIKLKFETRVESEYKWRYLWISRQYKIFKRYFNSFMVGIYTIDYFH